MLTSRHFLFICDTGVNWQADSQPHWDKVALAWCERLLVTHVPSVVMAKYMAMRDADPTWPKPGPSHTLNDIRSKVTRQGDNASDEKEDFVMEKKKHQAFEIFDYDSPNLFQVSCGLLCSKRLSFSFRRRRGRSRKVSNTPCRSCTKCCLHYGARRLRYP